MGTARGFFKATLLVRVSGLRPYPVEEVGKPSDREVGWERSEALDPQSVGYSAGRDAGFLPGENVVPGVPDHEGFTGGGPVRPHDVQKPVGMGFFAVETVPPHNVYEIPVERKTRQDRAGHVERLVREGPPPRGSLPPPHALSHA